MPSNHAISTITLYSKPGCHLCDAIREMLDDLLSQPSFQGNFAFDEVDIRLNPIHFEQFRYRIPIIMLNDTIIAEGRIDDATHVVLSTILSSGHGK